MQLTKTTLISACGAALLLASACSPPLSYRRANGNRVLYYSAEGGVVMQGNTRSKHGICVMPPAQGVRMRTGKGGGKLGGGAKGVEAEASASGESQHAVEKLYEQSAATIFLQHGLYRVCEMAANGAFDRRERDPRWWNKNRKIVVLDNRQYRPFAEMVFVQSYEVILLELELARSRTLEAARELAKSGTPADAAAAQSLLEFFVNQEAERATKLNDVSKITDPAELARFLDDADPAVRRAANRALWRLKKP